MLFVFNPRRHLGNSQTTTTTTTMAFNTKSIYFPEDIFKQIISYAQSLPKCEIVKCPCVATAECVICKDVSCKKHMATDSDIEGICASCVKYKYVRCDLCPGGEYTTMECENCAQAFCVECVARDEDGLICDGLCRECAPDEDE